MALVHRPELESYTFIMTAEVAGMGLRYLPMLLKGSLLETADVIFHSLLTRFWFSTSVDHLETQDIFLSKPLYNTKFPRLGN